MSVESCPPTNNNKYSALIIAESKRSRRRRFRDVTTLGHHRLACRQLLIRSQTVAAALTRARSPRRVSGQAPATPRPPSSHERTETTAQPLIT